MTGPALSLMARLRRLGVLLTIEDGHLSIDAPCGIVGPELMREIRRHKAALMAILATPTPSECESDAAGAPEPWPDGVPTWLADVMDGPAAKATREELPDELGPFAKPGDAGSIGYRKHLARIRRTAARGPENPLTQYDERRILSAEV